jgi:hypothetical protein
MDLVIGENILNIPMHKVPSPYSYEILNQYLAQNGVYLTFKNNTVPPIDIGGHLDNSKVYVTFTVMSIGAEIHSLCVSYQTDVPVPEKGGSKDMFLTFIDSGTGINRFMKLVQQGAINPSHVKITAITFYDKDDFDAGYIPYTITVNNRPPLPIDVVMRD